MSQTQMAAVVEAYDAASGTSRAYSLTLFEDGSVALYDVGRQRPHLKRSVPREPLTKARLRSGASVTINGVAYTVRNVTADGGGGGDDTTLVLVSGAPAAAAALTCAYEIGVGVGRVRLVTWDASDADQFAGAAGTTDTGARVTGTLFAVELLVGPEHAAVRAVEGSAGSAHRYSSPSAARAARDLTYATTPSAAAAAAACAPMPINVTAVVVKPHAVAAGALGAILAAIAGEGLDVVALRTATLTRRHAGELMEPYRVAGVLPRVDECIAELAAGPAAVLAVRGADATARMRALAGPFDPRIAAELRPASLRARFGVDAVRNAVHVTDVVEDGPLEAKFLLAVASA